MSDLISRDKTKIDPNAQARIKILHLEDNANDRELVAAFLNESGIDLEVWHAQNEKEFRDALQNGPFDLVLADKSLPGFDGLSALTILKKSFPATPFIFVTGSMGEEAAIETIKTGATDYILKNGLVRLGPAIHRALNEARERVRAMHAEERVREQAMLLDEAHDAILVCNLDGVIRFWNKGAQTLYGWTTEEASGKNIIDTLSKGNFPGFVTARQKAVNTGKWMGELTHQTKEGKSVLTESRWTLIDKRGAGPQSILIINTDITEKRQLEAQFLRAQRMESIGILAGGIAHDLNNVLAPILMASQLIRTQSPSPKSLEWLDMLEKSAGHGAELIKQILTFARGVEGEHIEVQISHLIREMQKMLREILPRSIRVEVNVPKNLWIIKAVPTHINQVLMNLSVNARDAMPNGGTLTISAANVVIDDTYLRLHPEGNRGVHVLINVTDTGTGIPPELLKKIYEPFFTTKEAGKGTGLGLSTVQGIVKNHGGFIHVYSEPGKGTSFKAYFPAASAGLIEDQTEHLEPSPRGHGEVILVVDDESAILEMTTSILEAHGYCPLPAQNGAEGVALFAKERERISLVLTDIMMPVMDGVAMIRALRALNPAIKIVILSGLMENYQVAQLATSDHIVTVDKPYTSRKLLTSVDNVLKGGRSVT
jgi:two-component system cell cycle sensor histidine kinase/response regulator CckA